MSDADALVEHLTDCRNASAAIVVDGNGDDVVAGLLAAGWTYTGVEQVAGKRVRYLTPPAGLDGSQ
jgi:hypothetical protein